jgi:NADPH-dependent 2,4-dienoyl-CoA reductase/sulfur reductase-like enzyme
LILLVAYNLHRAGCNIVRVQEAGPKKVRALDLFRFLNVPSFLLKGFRYHVALLGAGIPLKRGMTVLEARGDDEVTEVSVAPIDRSGRVDRSKVRSIKTEILVSGFGLTASSEITRLLGCEHVYRSSRGGWIPQRSADLETSFPGVFAVGDCAGIQGAEIAFLEGRIAGLNVALRLARETNRDGSKKIRSLRRKLSRFHRFQRGMDGIFAPPNNFLSLMTDETVVCRCEDVTAGEIYAKIHGSMNDINSIKTLTRTGMGRCQGRNCLGTLAEMVHAHTKYERSDSAFPRVRPPVRPISIGDVITGAHND